MRWLALVLGILILALQYPMWLGKGGWLQVRETTGKLAAQREANASSRRATRRSTPTCAT
jgi:cell division protein FtsB